MNKTNYQLTQQHLLKNPEKLAKFNKVIIWSGQWEAWWRKNGSGYTDNIKLAGIFSISEAWKRVNHCGPENRIILQSIDRKCEQCGAIINLLGESL